VSNQDPLDPPQDPDKTMLVPNPGGRRAAPASAAPPPQAAPSQYGAGYAQAAAAPLSVLPGSALNPLVRAANPLLDLVVPLRTTAQPPDLQQLREKLATAIKTFEAEARASGIAIDSIAAARYVLCVLLDETISSTAWGSGVWGTRSLLVAFHNEAFGGEKVFLILQKLSQNVPGNIDLLELMYMCLSLGLEGRYRVIDQGQAQLVTLRERLLKMIQDCRGARENDLSPNWRGENTKQVSPLSGIPVWVMAAAACALLLVMQLVGSMLLNSASDPVYSSLAKIRVAAPPPPSTPAPQAPAPTKFTTFLAPEIAQGLVSVKETPERSIITVRGDGMFGSGSAEVQDKVAPLMTRIGDALKTEPGKIIVIGHTDDTKPGLSARFPSNFDLSKARAAGVMVELVNRAGNPGRFSAEGRGDTEPAVDNNSPVNRARNRRVDIVVLTPPAPL
jgi:type VI secretion system protein ImpK